MQKTPISQYEKRVGQYQKQLNQQRKYASRLSNYRITTFILVVILAYILYRNGYTVFMWLLPVGGGVIFLGLIQRHQAIKEKMALTDALLTINQQGISRINGEWFRFSDTGEDLSPEDHGYAKDLDIFGENSVYQYLSTAETYLGRARLAELLTDGVGAVEQLNSRQAAAKELATMIDWRQKLQAQAGLVPRRQAPDGMIKWVTNKNNFFGNPLTRVLVYGLPLLTLLQIVLARFGIIGWLVPILLLTVQFGMSLYSALRFGRYVSLAGRFKQDLQMYYRLFELVEQTNFTSRLCCELQQAFGESACRETKRLARILECLDIRYSILYIVINTFTLWDYVALLALEKWKKRAGHRLKAWLSAVAEFETLASFATVSFENPDYAYPKFTQPSDGVHALDMGHPLIVPSERVTNGLSLTGPGTVLVITGSNMSGKSTYLRTIGVNLVLAYSGGPVCATKFGCPLVTLLCSIRVEDSLNKRISSFYAELMRVGLIVRQSRHKSVLFLVDEIFSGTNSRDRHLGAKTVISVLSNNRAMGLITTHDLELGQLASNNNQIFNYHFREYYRDGELVFDYKLRPGVSATTNALYLMKMVGIPASEVPDLAGEVSE